MSDTDPIAQSAADAWWQSLAPEVRQVWIIHITGWTLPGIIAHAHAKATSNDVNPALQRMLNDAAGVVDHGRDRGGSQ